MKRPTKPWTGHGEFRLRATPRGCFAITRHNTPRKRLHLITDASAIWVRPWPKGTPARFARMAALTKCGRWLHRADLHVQPVEDIDLCDYCALADELGPSGFAAAGILARLGERAA